MEEYQIIQAIRRGIREYRPETLSDSHISAVIIRGVTLVGLQIRQVDPSFFNERVSVASSGNIYSFSKPTDCLNIIKIWDLGDNAKTITGSANNGSGAIRITSVAHGIDDDEIVVIHDVGGTTEADGTWKVENSAANTLDLVGSTFTNAYTSGGKMFVDPSAPDEIELIDMAEADMSHTNKWYPRGDKIIVDDANFTNDIIVDYIKNPSAITDINPALHDWLVSFGIVDLMFLDPEKPVEYNDKMKTLRTHEARLAIVGNLINQTYRASQEPSYIRDVFKTL